MALIYLTAPREMITEVEVHHFAAFASDLGLPPGEWPRLIYPSKPMGNGRPFVRTAKQVDADGDIKSVRYDQVHGCCTLRIFNT